MKVVLAAALLLSPILCRAQDSCNLRSAEYEAYAARLARLVGGLQNNPWRGWKAGTVVVVRYLGDSVNGTDARAQPDLIYKVLESDRLFERTQELKGKSYRQEFLVKDQRGLASTNLSANVADAGGMELDGFELSSIQSVFSSEEFPGGTRTTREWSLGGYPSILLRQEVNGEGWGVTSANVSKRIGAREFACVEIKRRMRFYSDGPMEDVTTQYLSPEVPGHLVEEVKELFKVGEKGVLTPYMVVHQRVVELKIQ